MGFVFGSLRSSIACCFGYGFCSFCCTACPSCKGSTSTRIAYGLILFAGLITSCIMLVSDLGKGLINLSHLCQNSTSINESSNECLNKIGSLAVYRLSFGMTVFFFILSLLMIKVKSSSDHRAKIQNGFWGFKLIILIGMIIGSFYIPHNYFDFVLMIIGLSGGFLFIPIQLYLLVDFIHKWNASWVDQVELGSKKHGYSLLICTFLFYFLTIIGVILLYVFNGSGCSLHVFIISFNMCLCIILSIISISPWVRKYNSSCGLLQSSFVSVYVMYFTWSAMSNHSASSESIGEESLSNPITIIGLIMFVCAIFYSVITSTRNNRAKKLFLISLSSNDSGILDDAHLINSLSDNKWILGSEEVNHQRVYNDERGLVTYSYSLFHFMLLIATLYVMMTLTNWYNLAENFDRYNRDASLWIKVVSSWICVLLYGWSCIAPAIFPDRDFS